MKSFRVEVRCAFGEWGRYAVYMSAVCFGEGGAIVDYVSLSPRGEAAAQNVLQTAPCDHGELYLYVIAREFPATTVIAQAPPFDIEVIVTTDPASSPKTTTHPVNQWGGISLKLPLS